MSPPALSFFPLGPTRTVPVHIKHVRPVSHSQDKAHKANPSTKRARIASTPSSPSKKRALEPPPGALATPAPSSDDGPGPGPVAFKVPAVPVRVAAPLTPSTSTVAASSSPRHLADLASSPTRPRPTRPAMQVRLEAGETLVFGRHHVRNRPAVSTPPQAIVDKLAYPAHPARTVILDRAASHASRVHAAVELLSATSTAPAQIRLLVVGQNGLRVRAPGGKYRRVTPGAVRTYPAAPLEIEFYGAAVSISLEDPDETDEELFTPPTRAAEPIAVCAPSPLSLPPSSPPLQALSSPQPDDLSDDNMDVDTTIPLSEPVSIPTPPAPVARVAPPPVPQPVAQPQPQPLQQDDDALSDRSSSPLSDIEDDEPLIPAPPAAIAIKQEMLDDEPAKKPKPKSRATSPAPAKRAHTPAAKSRAPTPPPPPPPPAGVDMAALLASTVVFSGSSKLSLPDLVRSLLESQPNMRDHGDEAAWAVWADVELAANPMFGKITRNGRDSSGKPLQPHYFYNPANDPDPARARELGGLVRPLRATQRGGGRAIDWRPVGPGRRRY